MVNPKIVNYCFQYATYIFLIVLTGNSNIMLNNNDMHSHAYLAFLFFFFVFLSFLGMHPQHMEVPRLGI